VRHARPEDLEELGGLLDDLRALPGLTERAPGNFSRSSKAFLHFHADPTGMYADARLDPAGDFERFRVTTRGEQRVFLRAVTRALSPA
jgi:hypothetical protein